MDLDKQENTDRPKTMKTVTTLYDLMQQINEHFHTSLIDGAVQAKSAALWNKDRIIAEIIADKFESGCIQFVNQDMFKISYRDIFD